MAGFQPARSRVGFFTDDSDEIDDWMAQRNAQARMRDTAEAAGREAWESATRQGEWVAAPRLSDVIALGARQAPDPEAVGVEPEHVEDGEAVERQQPLVPDGDLKRLPHLRFISAKPGDTISRIVRASDPRAVGRFLSLNNMDPDAATLRPGLNYVAPTTFDDASDQEADAGRRLLAVDNARVAARAAERTRRRVELERSASLLNAGRNIWTGEPVKVPPRAKRSAAPVGVSRSWLDNSVAGKRALGDAAAIAGLGYGVVRGGWHALDGLGTAARLFNPLDPLLSAPGEAAWDRVVGGGERIGAGVARRVADPTLLRQDFHRANVALIPEASPMGSTVRDELGRRFHISANQGELLSNLATIPVGREVGSGLEALEYAGEAGNVGKYLR